jgi:DNA-binding transcriptional LysR family regulator
MKYLDKRSANVWWSHLHWLAVLEQQGSFTAAAAHLGVSKAAMSQRVSELERAVGIPLVQRTTRSVRLTEVGQHLVEDTREAFDHIAQTFVQAKDAAGEPRGLLRITAPVALARQQLVRRLPAFLEQYPGVRVHLDMADRLTPLAAEGFDLAVRHVANPPETHVARVLCETQTVLVASPSYVKRAGAPTQPQALSEHQCLTYPRAQSAPTWTFEPVAKRRGARGHTVAVAGPFAANNSEALRDAAIAGLGLALLPDFSAQDALRRGELVRVLPQWQAVGVFAPRIID